MAGFHSVGHIYILHVDFVLHREQLPLTSLSHASFLSINSDALKLWN